MASDPVELISVLEKLVILPSHLPDIVKKYDVKAGRVFKTQIEASSSYEAALKASFALLELGLLSHEATLVEVHESRNIYRYAVTKKANLPHVSIHDMEVYEATEVINDSGDGSNLLGQASAAVENEWIENTLKAYFGFGEFRPLQKETIVSTLQKQNVLTVLSTGGGKSLTYMLPAVLASKPTLVISPIKSLIFDQVQRCKQLGITACYFTGDVSADVIESQIKDLQRFKLVFSTPEMLEQGAFSETIYAMFETNDIERVVFDEAHTISTWGGTFRPLYKLVCQRLSRTTSTKLLLSATINHNIETELKEMFGNLTVYRHSVFRENLFLEVKERSNKLYDDLAELIMEREGQCGIIYAVLPSEVAKIHSELIKRNIKVVKYHGQLSDEVKTASIHEWTAGSATVIVANASFGMGVDRPDVRYVIHSHIPPCMDDYFQQCGRAGRDGSPALCRLYYSYADKASLYKLFSYQENNSQVQYANLNELIAFLENPIQCRHKAIMSYYGEIRENFICVSGCDNCKNRGTYLINDGTTDAMKIVQAVVELSGRQITCNTLKLFLAKSNQKIIRDNGLDALDNYGALEKKFTPVVLLEKFLHILIAEDILAERVEKKGRSICFSITLGSRAHELLALNINVHKYEKVK